MAFAATALLPATAAADTVETEGVLAGCTWLNDNYTQWLSDEVRQPGKPIFWCHAEHTVDAEGNIVGEPLMAQWQGLYDGVDVEAQNDLENWRPLADSEVYAYRIMYWAEAPYNEFVDYSEGSGNVRPRPVLASGDIFVATTPDGPAENASIILYNRGIELDTSDDPDMIASFQAGVGNIVAVPHYVGFDNHIVTWLEVDDRNFYDAWGWELLNTTGHPYMHAQSTGASAVDMLSATREVCATTGLCTPNGETYVVGASMGGHVAVAALEELESTEQAVAGATILSGAFDVAAVARHHLALDCAGRPDYLGVQAMTAGVVGLNDIYNLGAAEEIFDSTWSFRHKLCPEDGSVTASCTESDAEKASNPNGEIECCNMAEFATVNRFPVYGPFGKYSRYDKDVIRVGADGAACSELSPVYEGDLTMNELFNADYLQALSDLDGAEGIDCAALLASAPVESSSAIAAQRTWCALEANSLTPDAGFSTDISVAACSEDRTIPMATALTAFIGVEGIETRDLSPGEQEPFLEFDWVAETQSGFGVHAACVLAGGVASGADYGLPEAPPPPGSELPDPEPLPVSLALSMSRRTIFFGYKEITVKGWDAGIRVDLYKNGSKYRSGILPPYKFRSWNTGGKYVVCHQDSDPTVAHNCSGSVTL